VNGREPTGFRGVDGRYVFSVLDGDIEFVIDQLRRERYNLVGELEVRCFLKGAQTHNDVLSVGNFNCSSARAPQDHARYLSSRARTGEDVDFAGYLEEFRQRVVAAERRGQPAVALHEIPRPTAGTTLDVFGFRIFLDQPQIMFAPGGTGKSLLTLAIGGELGRRGIRTLLLDWELDGGEHRVRRDALALPETIYYRRCDQPLSVLSDSIKREMVDRDLRFVLCDSIAPACHGKPEDAEAAIDFFKAFRRIGAGGLAIAHTRAENGEEKPFGSIFWHNLARSTWFLRRAGDTTSADAITLGVFHRKCNLGRLRPPFGLELSCETDNDDSETLTRVRVRQIDVSDVAELATALPLWQRMRQALKAGPLTLAELSKELGAKTDTIDKAVRRRDQTFTRLTRTSDGMHRIALVERRAS
jgi:hypothetical protein